MVWQGVELMRPANLRLWSWPPSMDCLNCRRYYVAGCEQCADTRIDAIPWSEVMTFGRDETAYLEWFDGK